MAEDVTLVIEPPEDGEEDEFQLRYVGAPEEVIRELLELEAEDKLDPETVAQRARDPQNPLHPLIFREDDSIAAWRFRVERAQRLIQRVRIVPIKIREVEGGGVAQVEVSIRTGDAPRAFTSVEDGDGRQRYKETRRALREDHAYVLRTLNAEVKAMVRRRMLILSLDEISTVITEAVAELRATIEGSDDDAGTG